MFERRIGVAIAQDHKRRLSAWTLRTIRSCEGSGSGLYGQAAGPRLEQGRAKGALHERSNVAHEVRDGGKAPFIEDEPLIAYPRLGRPVHPYDLAIRLQH